MNDDLHCMICFAIQHGVDLSELSDSATEQWAEMKKHAEHTRGLVKEESA